MTAAEAKTRIKLKFGLADSTTMDTEIDDSISIACDLLAPYLNLQSDTPTEFAIGAADIEIDLATSNQVNKVYAYWTEASEKILYTGWSQVGQKLMLHEDTGSAFTLVVYFNDNYALATIDDIPQPATVPLIDFACAEFAAVLAGNKTLYNSYTQATGARSVESMAELSDFYEQRGVRRAERIADAEGLS